MTPANIVMMAVLKGLDVIAITDHNSCRNCKVAMEIGKEQGLMVLPGMELTTAEEVHIVCLFPTIEDAMEFDSFVYDHLLKIKNKEAIFGNQLIVDREEQVIQKEEYLLINATSIGFSDAFNIISKYNGIMIPAHIDKNSNSVISNLGFLPPDSRFLSVEMAEPIRYEGLFKGNPYLSRCLVITNSDAHTLGAISEPVHQIEVQDRSPMGILAALSMEKEKER